LGDKKKPSLLRMTRFIFSDSNIFCGEPKHCYTYRQRICLSFNGFILKNSQLQMQLGTRMRFLATRSNADFYGLKNGLKFL
jgi:hypothetical protein